MLKIKAEKVALQAFKLQAHKHKAITIVLSSLFKNLSEQEQVERCVTSYLEKIGEIAKPGKVELTYGGSSWTLN